MGLFGMIEASSEKGRTGEGRHASDGTKGPGTGARYERRARRKKRRRGQYARTEQRGQWRRRAHGQRVEGDDATPDGNG